MMNRVRSSARGCVSIRGREISMFALHLRLPGPLFDTGMPRSLSSRYLEYSSIISCSCTGASIWSRVGMFRTVAFASPAFQSSHWGSGRPVWSWIDSWTCRLPRMSSFTWTMSPELACLVTRAPEAGAVHHVVQAGLQELQEGLAGHALALGGLLVVAVELPLEHPVDAPRLLLLAQLHEVLRLLGAAAAVLAGRIGTPLHRALGALAL